MNVFRSVVPQTRGVAKEGGGGSFIFNRKDLTYFDTKLQKKIDFLCVRVSKFSLVNYFFLFYPNNERKKAFVHVSRNVSTHVISYRMTFLK